MTRDVCRGCGNSREVEYRNGLPVCEECEGLLADGGEQREPLPEWPCARPRCSNPAVNPHEHSLCPKHHPGDEPPEQTTADQFAIASPDSQTRPASIEEAEAVTGAELPEARPSPAISFEFADWIRVTELEDEEDDVQEVDWMAAAMGDPGVSAQVAKDPEPTTPTSSAGGGAALPTSIVPLGQLDALPPEDRRRAARKRGLNWPSTDEARDRLEETIHDVMAHEDQRVIDAPTSLGKTHTVAATRWGARDDLTGDRPVVHLLETRDARDEAVEVAREHGGDHMVLLSRHEACPVAAGDYDPPSAEADQEELDYQPITMHGQPASEWISEVCDGRGIPFSAAHRRLEEANDQGTTLPCCSGSPTTYDEDEGEFDDGESSKCPAIEQWDRLREGDHPLVIATHNFAHVPGLRANTNIVIDEQPDFAQDFGDDVEQRTARVRSMVSAYLQYIDAPVSTWEGFIQLSRHDGYQGDAANERDALANALDETPEREWYFENPQAHTLAPAIARAIFHAEERSNGRRFGRTPHEPPRLDAQVHDDDSWNREWVSVVVDDNNDVRTVRVTPDFGSEESSMGVRSLIGLDAHPALPKWQANTTPWIQRREVLDSQERQLWRRYERGLRVVQVGEATRPLASGEYFDHDATRTFVEHLVDEYGYKFRTAITASSVEDQLKSIMTSVSDQPDAVETMHYGEEKSRNDFANEEVGLVNGSIDPGDDHVLDLLAELDLDAEPERGDVCCKHCGDREEAPEEPGDGCRECLGTGWTRKHGRSFTGPDADTAQAILASVRESHTAQAAGRYARNPEDPTSTATVFVRTDAMPPGFADVQVPGVVWTYSGKQDRIVTELREASRPLSARELADRADCSKEHVRKTLKRLLPDEDDDRRGAVQAYERAGEHGATLYTDDGAPNSGVVDLDDIANDPVWGSYTWSLAIRDPLLDNSAAEADGEGPEAGVSTTWDWESVTDPPSDTS